MHNSAGAVLGGITGSILGMLQSILNAGVVNLNEISRSIIFAMIGAAAGWFVHQVLNKYVKARFDKFLSSRYAKMIFDWFINNVKNIFTNKKRQ